MALIPVMLMPLLTTSLGSEGYGELTKFLGWAAVIAQVGLFGMDAVVQRKVFEERERVQDYYLLSLCVVPICVLLCVILFAALIDVEMHLLALISLYAVNQAFLGVNLMFQQSVGKHITYLKVIILYVIFNIGITYGLFGINASIENRIIAIVLSLILVNCYSLYLLPFRLVVSNSFKTWLRNEGLSNALLIVKGVVPNYIGAMLTSHYFKFFVSENLGDSVLGTYYASFQIALFVQFALAGITSAVNPWLMSNLETGSMSPFKIWAFSTLLMPLVYGMSLFFIPILKLLFESLTSSDFQFRTVDVQLLIAAFILQAIANIQIPSIYYKSRYVMYGATSTLSGIAMYTMLHSLVRYNYGISSAFIVAYGIQYILYSFIGCRK